MRYFIFIILGLVGSAHAGQADLPTPGPVINIVEWDGQQLPAVYERSCVRIPMLF